MGGSGMFNCLIGPAALTIFLTDREEGIRRVFICEKGPAGTDLT